MIQTVSADLDATLDRLAAALAAMGSGDPSPYAAMWAAGRDVPVRALTDPLPPHPLPPLPRRYVYCTDKPGADSFGGLAAAARADSSWRFDQLPTGHDAMITAPRELAALLADQGRPAAVAIT